MKSILFVVVFLLLVPSLLSAEDINGNYETDETHVGSDQESNTRGTPYNPYGLPTNNNPSDGKTAPQI